MRWLFFLLPFFCATLWALEVPPLAGRVNDNAGMLPADVKTRLEAKLAALEKSDSTQIVVLTVPSLQGDSIEDFSLRVAEKWAIGKRGRDNGALLVVAKEDRELRIEVGYGLEGKLTDALSNRIIRNIIVPRFREGDFAGGVEAGVDAMIAAVKGEFVPEEGSGTASYGDLFFAGVVLLAFFVFLIAVRSGRGPGGPGGGIGGGRFYRSPTTGRWGGFFGGGRSGGGGFSGGGGRFGGGGSSGKW